MNNYLTESEQTTLLTTIKQFSDELAQRDYYIVMALIHSGMRITEFRLITVGDAVTALNTNYLYIPKENRKGKKQDHSIYLTKSLRMALINLLSIRESNNSEHYLISGRTDDNPMCSRNLQKRVKQWAEEAGLKHLNITPHFFRHTHAMNILRRTTAKEPLRIIKSALGHRNINTTSIYTEASREDVVAALEETDSPRPNRVTISTLRNINRSRV